MTFEDHAKELLALAFCQFNEPLWKGRYEVEKYLTENFFLKELKEELTREIEGGVNIQGGGK